MREIRQQWSNEAGGDRRWFLGDELELIVWMDRRDNVTGFELSYDRSLSPHALVWRVEQGMSHYRIDEGEADPRRHKASPILIADGPLPVQEILRQFDRSSIAVEPRIRSLVIDRLRKVLDPMAVAAG